MAKRVQVMLVDDIDGTDAVETVSFSLDGVSYEIDLTAANAKKLRHDFETWKDHARRSGGRKSSRQAGATAGQRRRTWAQSGSGRARTVTRSATVAASPRASSRPTTRPIADAAGRVTGP